ncbi:hypothetical protein JOC34_001876 [Virgibacillus halotolerans]|uniref:lipoprotein BA_5634 family protein n=1 Tax=Virgibacillus halotolerans TaxID=1071053 RepID=UPI001961F8B6|nr:lipoprotein BA_5634 family protein [Virgibacillus halotolerans]MBM7599508.1 hypothetical protein [Virgibacillus halotolerans]
MKKIIGLCLTIIVAGSLMSGCGQIKDIFEKGNGVIIYGDDNAVKNGFKEHKKHIKEKDSYPYKTTETGDQTVIILEKKTASVLIEKGLLKEVLKDSETEAMKKLPKTSKGEAILFAKENMDKLEINDHPIDISYGGNTIIGDGRTYGDIFLIVDKSNWEKIDEEEKTMGIIQFDKDPKKLLKDFDVDAFQLVKIES